MPSRFQRGAVAYAKDGRSYVVDDIEGDTIYCSGEGGAETEFPESMLLNATEWAARAGGRRGTLYSRLKQSRAFNSPATKLDRAASTQLIDKVERLSPGLLDFAAFTAACREMRESGDTQQIPELSIVKIRELFDGTTPEVRAGLVASLLGAAPDVLLSAGRLGDNLMRAMLDKGLAAHTEAYEAFRRRPRR